MHCSCWLDLTLIWAFFGPVCVIIAVSNKIILELNHIHKTDFSTFKKTKQNKTGIFCLSGKHCLLSHHCVEVGTEVLKFKS